MSYFFFKKSEDNLTIQGLYCVKPAFHHRLAVGLDCYLDKSLLKMSF